LTAFARGWKTEAGYEVSRSLRLLLGWVGVDSPILRSLPTTGGEQPGPNRTLRS
jgi:hypothetical protein